MSVFSRLENCPTASDVFFSSDGRLFHDDGPAAEKLRGPKLTVLVLGVTKSPRTADRRWVWTCRHWNGRRHEDVQCSELIRSVNISWSRLQSRGAGPLFRRSPIPRVKLWLQLQFDYDTTTIRLRSDYDVSRAPASIRRDSSRSKKNMPIFLS